MDKAYLEGVRTVDVAPDLKHRPIPRRGLLSRADLVDKLGITRSSESVKKSSHGEIWFGTLDATRTRVVIKFMPVEADKTRRIATSSYVDPFLAWLGSQLVTHGKSTAFAQLFGTFLCFDTFKDGVNGLPLVAMLSEELGTKLDDTVEAYMEPGNIQWRPLIAVVLQVMVVLSQAHSMSLVHNDAHMGNFLIAKNCAKMPMYVDVRGQVLNIPVSDRVVLMDFGRSTLGAVDCPDTSRCTGRLRSSFRLHASEVGDKFSKWDLDNPGADVNHFVAMLLLCQRRPHMLREASEKPDAPPEARALMALIQKTLQCDNSRNMFSAYSKCNADELQGLETKCGKHLIHELRNKGTGCKGLRPIDFLTDAVLTAPFLATTPIPPTETIYSPEFVLV